MTELQTRVRELRAPEDKQTFHTKVDYLTTKGNEKSAFFDVQAVDPAQAEFEATKIITENGQRRCDKVLDVAVSLDDLKADMPTDKDRAKSQRKQINSGNVSAVATALAKPTAQPKATAVGDIALPKRRGRPPGSKNRLKVHAKARTAAKAAHTTTRNTARKTVIQSKRAGSNLVGWIAGAVGALGLSAIGALALNRK